MTEIQNIFQNGWQEYCRHFNPSDEQSRAAFSIMNCKTGKFGYNISRCEMIDAGYFHVIFTIPAQLNPLVYANQKLMYALLHKCCAETLLELSRDKKYLSATPGIIQVLHTWGQELNYHPHIHCIVSGGGLTKTKDLKLCTGNFFVRVEPLVKKFRGKFLHYLQQYYQNDALVFPASCMRLKNRYDSN